MAASNWFGTGRAGAPSRAWFNRNIAAPSGGTIPYAVAGQRYNAPPPGQPGATGVSLPPSYGNPFMGLTAPANGGFFGMFQPYPQDNAVAVTPFEPPPLPPYNTGGGNMGYQQPATVGGNGVMLAPQGFLLPALFGPYSQMNNFQPPTYGGGGVG